MKKSGLFLLLLLALAACQVTKSGKSSQPKPLFTLGEDHSVYADEFLYVYNKNNFNNDSTANEREAVEEYLELFVNFKLKVLEATERGMDQEEAFIEEFKGYRKQLAQPYLTDTSLNNKLVEEAYANLQEMVSASHILFMLDEYATPEDTTQVYNRIMDVRQQVIDGGDFATLARQYSEDPSAQVNGGSLGWFTGGRMVYDFEKAAYGLQPGELSMPVRTQFGYHIVQLHERRPAQGKIATKHIMIHAAAGIAEADSLAAKQKIDEIYRRIEDGEDWDALARQFSTDVRTRDKGGELPVFGFSDIVPEFATAAYALEVGSYSEPVKTPYGWHIIQLVRKVPLATFEEMKQDLEAKIARDARRTTMSKERMLARFKRNNQFVLNKGEFDHVLNVVDSTLVLGTWKVPEGEKGSTSVLFSQGTGEDTENTTTDDFYSYLLRSQRRQGGNRKAEQYLMQLYSQFEEERVMAYEEKLLPKKYPDYRMLLQEYRDGILLFALMDQEVWTKAVSDTAGLNSYFGNHRESYQWPKRLRASVFNAANDSILETIKPQVNQGYVNTTIPAQAVVFAGDSTEISDDLYTQLQGIARRMKVNDKLMLAFEMPQGNVALNRQRSDNMVRFMAAQGISEERILVRLLDDGSTSARAQLLTTDPKALERLVNVELPLGLLVEDGTFAQGDNQWVDKFFDADPGIYRSEADGRVAQVKVWQVEAPRNKELNEVRGQVISDYQQSLEKQWVEQLRAKYPVKINDNVLNEVLKTLESGQ